MISLVFWLLVFIIQTIILAISIKIVYGVDFSFWRALSVQIVSFIVLIVMIVIFIGILGVSVLFGGLVL